MSLLRGNERAELLDKSTVVRDAPVSVLDKLAPASRTARALPFRPMARSVQPAKRVIGGGSQLLVRVDAAR